MNSDEKFYLWSCTICDKDLTDKDDYAEIMYYRADINKVKRFHFCRECFETVGGKEYML